VVICGTAVLAVKYRKLHGHIGTVQNLTMHKKKVLVPLRDKDCTVQYSVNRCCSSTRVHVTQRRSCSAEEELKLLITNSRAKTDQW